MGKMKITVIGEGASGQMGKWMAFRCKDSTENWYEGEERVTIESPALFEHIAKRVGAFDPNKVVVKITLEFGS